MSSPSLRTEDPSGPSSPMSTASAGAPAGVLVDDFSPGEGEGAIEASRGGPPAEVLEQIAAAEKIYERLRASGAQMRFFPADDCEPIRIELHDRDGNAVRTLSVLEAVEMAAGKPLG